MTNQSNVAFLLEAFKNRIKARTGLETPIPTPKMVEDPELTEDAFRIFTSHDDEICLSYGGISGCAGGLGKLLRNASYEDRKFAFGKWRGTCQPAKPYRIMYLASHFFNFYENAPEEVLREYICDLAFYGYNYLALAIPVHVYNHWTEPAFNRVLKHVKTLYLMGNAVGMKGHICFNNIGMLGSDASLRAVHPGHCFFGTEICPSKDEGIVYLRDMFSYVFDQLRDIDMALVCAWSYDQGGCGCASCKPFGANGIYKVIDAVWPIAKRMWPQAKLIQSTWEYDWEYGRDNPEFPEWHGLYRRLESNAENKASIVMADSHGDYPRFPLEHPLPDGVELISFPEISMHGRSPWGGFGATPQPRRFQRLWGQVNHLAAGGRIYSEGIFEDFNKFLYACFFVSGHNEIDLAIREYAHYFLGIENVKAFKDILTGLEQNHEFIHWAPATLEGKFYRKKLTGKPGIRCEGEWHPLNTEKILKTVLDVDKSIPEFYRRQWRWRLIVLRAIIDHELFLHDGAVSETCEEALVQLYRLYFTSTKTTGLCAPYTNAWLQAQQYPTDNLVTAQASQGPFGLGR